MASGVPDRGSQRDQPPVDQGLLRESGGDDVGRKPAGAPTEWHDGLDRLLKVADELSQERNAENGSLESIRAEISELRDELDALQFDVEKYREVGWMAREIRHYFRAKRDEVRALLLWRAAAILFALVMASAILGVLAVEFSAGFTRIRTLPEHISLPAAVYIGTSFGFVGLLILSIIRGLFSAVKDAQDESNLPPHWKEFLDAIKGGK